jgi:hypothetical protein
LLLLLQKFSTKVYKVDFTVAGCGSIASREVFHLLLAQGETETERDSVVGAQVFALASMKEGLV